MARSKPFSWGKANPGFSCCFDRDRDFRASPAADGCEQGVPNDLGKSKRRTHRDSNCRAEQRDPQRDRDQDDGISGSRKSKPSPAARNCTGDCDQDACGRLMAELRSAAGRRSIRVNFPTQRGFVHGSLFLELNSCAFPLLREPRTCQGEGARGDFVYRYRKGTSEGSWLASQKLPKPLPFTGFSHHKHGHLATRRPCR